MDLLCSLKPKTLMTDATVTILISNAVVAGGVLTQIIITELRRRNARLDREQDRLDREQIARMTSIQLDEARLAGDARLKKVIEEVDKTRTVAIKAFKEANDVNKKIESLGIKIANPLKPKAPLK